MIRFFFFEEQKYAIYQFMKLQSPRLFILNNTYDVENFCVPSLLYIDKFFCQYATKFKLSAQSWQKGWSEISFNSLSVVDVFFRHLFATSKGLRCLLPLLPNCPDDSLIDDPWSLRGDNAIRKNRLHLLLVTILLSICIVISDHRQLREKNSTLIPPTKGEGSISPALLKDFCSNVVNAQRVKYGKI